jgi:hypothetical protein
MKHIFNIILVYETCKHVFKKHSLQLKLPCFYPPILIFLLHLGLISFLLLTHTIVVLVNYV